MLIVAQCWCFCLGVFISDVGVAVVGGVSVIAVVAVVVIVVAVIAVITVVAVVDVAIDAGVNLVGGAAVICCFF